MNKRGEFSSSIGFIMAASGSAIGLGNIWGFPSQTAKNGGAAFVLVYLILAFIIAYPALMAELIIGRHAKSNPVGAFQKIRGGKPFVPIGFLGLIVAGLILSFYSIVAGWMLGYVVEPIFKVFGMEAMATWATENIVSRNLVFTTIFFVLTILIISGGVQKGIEKWSTRLMPSLIFIIICLTIYVFTLEGASDGVKAYLLPDFSRVFEPELLISAMGQAFFSLSLGVGTMLVYGSYISPKENLSRLGIFVTLADVFIAFLAGLLIIPAIYVAAANGAQIFDESGNLIEGGTIVFQAIPHLFSSMGIIGIPLSIVFFLLMSIAALTSSISMLEVPVSYVVDNLQKERRFATWIIGIGFWLISVLIIFNFDALFDLTINVTTKYSQPLIGLLFCVFIGWVMSRNEILNELEKGFPDARYSLFFKVWWFFVRIITPLLILGVFIHSIL
ncbi:MAG: sodium-dependent transporter [Bacteroidota bacterium]|nr:sodium-dependent transporter [Bacteroidota bacterium]